MTVPKARIISIKGNRIPATVKKFFERPAIEEAAESVASRVLQEIRQKGDAAVLKYIREFDKAGLKTPAAMRVSQKALEGAAKKVSPSFKKAAREAHKRVAEFCRSGIREDWSMPSPRGGEIGEMFIPLQRVGCYIPGGASPLASTAIMSVTLAKEAGVEEIVACSPAGKNGQIDPNILFALHLSGATEVYKVGGIQAIGAMAYGTKTIPRVQKIVGPGGPYVTAAKRLVYGAVDLDMIAGPSEIAVLADSSAPPSHIAADLLSQAEHGTGSEKALLVTSSEQVAREVQSQLVKQAAALPRREVISRVLKHGTLLVVVENIAIGMNMINAFAPEHFELMVRQPRKWISKVKTAGAVFVGPWTPEPAGDFAVGPSHVLPTGGAAAVFSGLSVDSFRRRSSVMTLTRADLVDMLPVIEAFSEVEGLEAHARSARVRFGR